MNRRIGRLLSIGLFAALPIGWTATALAQNTSGSGVSGDTGINPLPQDNSLTKDQKKAGDIDQNLGNPGSKEQAPGSMGANPRSDTMGTSGSSGSTQGEKKDQAGSQESGSAGAVPGAVDTKDIQKSSGHDEATPSKHKKSTSSTTVKESTDEVTPSDQKKLDEASPKVNDTTPLPGDSSDINK